MNSLSDTNVDDVLASELLSNETPLTSGDWSVAAAVADVAYLWASTERSNDAARSSLYNFLAAIYVHAHRVAGSETALRALRTAIRPMLTKQKARVEDASAEWLLLVSALGVQQGSLRSKYKALLDRAATEQVRRDRESFKLWVRSKRGIVKTLRDASTTSSPEPTIRDRLLANRVAGMGPLPMIGNKPPSDTFHLVIYRVDGSTLVPCFQTDEVKVVGTVLRLVRPLVTKSASASVSEDVQANGIPASGLRKVA